VSTRWSRDRACQERISFDFNALPLEEQGREVISGESAENLSKDLARDCLCNYMLKIPRDDERVTGIVNFFSDYDIHKSHGRSIDRAKARELGLKVTNLVRGLYNQYEYLFDRSTFYKLFENTRGVSWGRQYADVNIQIPTPQSTP
jgi:hypothetical protein